MHFHTFFLLTRISINVFKQQFLVFKHMFLFFMENTNRTKSQPLILQW